MSGSYDCMTPEELAFWLSSASPYVKAVMPCIDCPLWFQAKAKEAGCCDREIGHQGGRPPSDNATPERRAQWREASRRRRRQASQ